ncbi:MAG: benzoate/H(+) symporter BenE family transporter [Bacteriovorax sp.]|nr:benzoate/H(+) symporter BenE family transporter [Bacteriovorax sp.]
MRKVLKDYTLSAFIAGFVAVLVGYTSSAVIVFQAAIAAGATPVEASSWLGIICVSMGALTVYLSVKYRIPVMFAWSTAGAALLITSLHGFQLPDIIGAFVFSAFLIFLCGVTGLFEKVMNKIPVALASAMLAGILFHLVLEVFTSMQTMFWPTFVMFIVYIFGRRFFPRYNIFFVLVSGVMIAWLLNLLHYAPVNFDILKPVFTMPTFNLTVLMSIGIPLFVVTMASQNLTGIAVMKTYGYKPKISKLISWSGFINILIAPFGGFALNLSAVTAAICMGHEAHPDHDKRYTASVSMGLIYIVVGIYSGVVASLFATFPKELIMAIAGLALMNTVNSGLTTIFDHKEEKESAMITFFVTASGVSMLGVGAAFWGLVAGSLAGMVLKYKRGNS